MRPAPNVSPLQLLSWAWWTIFPLFIPSVTSFTQLNDSPSSTTLGLFSLPSDQDPRAAFVSLVHEDDLSPILTSIQELETTFNSRYQYHWVFFSTEPLGEEFRRETSNATGATCLYEVIPRNDWSVHPGFSGQHSPSSDNRQLGFEDAGFSPSVYHWNLGSFAQQERMRDYDWFWRVEPGVRFDHHINFDVFRFMQDHGIAYGFPESPSNKNRLDVLSPQIKMFIDKNPAMVHADADMAWLLNERDSERVTQSFGRNAHGPVAREAQTDTVPRTISEASHHRTLYPGADWSQFLSADDSKASHASRSAHDDTASLADLFTTWLLDMYEGSFELGSLAFFRSPNHKALMNHLHEVNSAQPCSPVENVPAHSLSASILLPKQSVWNFRKKMTRHATLPPTPTADPHHIEEQRHPVTDRGAQLFYIEAMRDQLQFWETVVADMYRQSAEPSLLSGFTVIDDRVAVCMRCPESWVGRFFDALSSSDSKTGSSMSRVSGDGDGDRINKEGKVWSRIFKTFALSRGFVTPVHQQRASS